MSRKSYTKEFKLEAVKLILEQGRSQAEAARNLGVSQAVLGRWVRQFQENGNGSFPGRGNLVPLDEENRRLQRELKRVTMERDILKKAIGYFTEQSK